MTAIELHKLNAFFSEDRNCFKEIVLTLLNTLEKETTFRLKIQKASIHLCSEISFAVIAFRKSLPHFFIEFYGSERIDHLRIIKTIIKSDRLIIHRVNIRSSIDIDRELLNWLQSSQAIAE